MMRYIKNFWEDMMFDWMGKLILASIALAFLFMGYIALSTYFHIEQQEAMVQEAIETYKLRIAKYK